MGVIVVELPTKRPTVDSSVEVGVAEEAAAADEDEAIVPTS